MSKRKFGAVALAAILVAAGATHASDAPLSGSYARLSPDGSKVALISTMQGKETVSVHALVDGAKDGKIVRADDFEITWVRWKDNDHLIAGVRSTVNPSLTRLVSFDANGEHVKMIGEPYNGFTPPDVVANNLTPRTHPRHQDTVLSVLPRAPGAILQAVLDFAPQNDTEFGTAIYRVDTETAVHKLVDAGDVRISSYLVDKNADARIGIDTTGGVVFARAGGSGPWREVHRKQSGEVFIPLAFTSDDPSLLYVFSNKGAEGKAGLSSFNVETARFVKLIDEQADIDGKVSAQEGELLGYTRKDGSHFYINPAWQADYLAVAKAMKGAETTIIDRSADGALVLLEVHKPQEPKVWWVLDRTAKPLNLWAAVEDRPVVSATMVQPSR